MTRAKCFINVMEANKLAATKQSLHKLLFVIKRGECFIKFKINTETPLCILNLGLLLREKEDYELASSLKTYMQSRH